MNMLFLYVIYNLNIINSVFCNINNDENFYRDLPPIYHIDDYEKCKLENKFFCKVSITLKPSSRNFSKHWKLIELSLEDKAAYNHNELFHAICLQDYCPESIGIEEKHCKDVISKCYERKLNLSGVIANVTHLNCTNFDKIHQAGTGDIIWLLLVILYIIFVFWATYWDYFNKKYLSHDPCTQFVCHFSLIKNFKKLKRINSNEDFQKLKCLQGIRFYNMLLIIFCHTYSSYIGGYVMNTEYIENIPNNIIKLGLTNLMVFLVQTYFLFSAFLLSYHFFQIMDKNKEFSPKTLWLMFINRYLRILPPVTIMILMGSTMWVVSFFYGPIKDLYSDLEHHMCKKNWWTTLLFINNHYNQQDMCYFITWYLAADTQLYILSLIILSIIWKYKRNTEGVLASFVILGVIIPVVISYTYDLDIIFRITPENTKNNKFRSFKFNAIYSSTYANMATYMTGLCFGCLYFHLKDTKIIINKRIAMLWYTIFFGLPLLVVTISSQYYSRVLSAILCGILKPIYATGIAFGILGMSKGLGGIVKNVCEWKPALVLGNLTYSTYIVHYVIVFYRTATAKQPLYVSDAIMIKSFTTDVIISFFCGFLMHIFVEIPATNIQNLFIPQIRNERLYTDIEKSKQK